MFLSLTFWLDGEKPQPSHKSMKACANIGCQYKTTDCAKCWGRLSFSSHRYDPGEKYWYAIYINGGKTRRVYTRLKPPEKDMGSAKNRVQLITRKASLILSVCKAMPLVVHDRQSEQCGILGSGIHSSLRFSRSLTYSARPEDSAILYILTYFKDTKILCLHKGFTSPVNNS